MYCYKCGNQMPQDSKFCDKCGSAQPGSAKNANLQPTTPLMTGKRSGNRIMILVVCVVMILSMALLPMVTLRSDTITHTYTKKVISLLGECNLSSGESFVTTLNRTAFVLMLGAMVAVVLFAFTSRKVYSVLAAIANFAVLLLYGVFVMLAWIIINAGYDHIEFTLPHIGGLVCTAGAIMLIGLTVAELRNVDVRKVDWKQEAKKLSKSELLKEIKKK